MPRKARPVRDRYEEKVDRSGECHLWTAALDQWGYGLFWAGGWHDSGSPRMVRAHRWAWEQEHGPISRGLVVMHACDTPACQRLDHLSLGTVTQNNEDMKRKGRLAHGERHPDARLTEVIVRAIREDRRGESVASLAREYGVTPRAITAARLGLTWKHIK